MSFRLVDFSSRLVDLSSCRVDLSPRRVDLSSDLVAWTCLLASACGLVVSSFSLVVLSSCILNTEMTLGQKKKQAAQAQVPTCDSGEFSFKIDELNVVKDLLSDTVSCVDQIPTEDQIHRPRVLKLLIKNTSCLLVRAIQVFFNFFFFSFI